MVEMTEVRIENIPEPQYGRPHGGKCQEVVEEFMKRNVPAVLVNLGEQDVRRARFGYEAAIRRNKFPVVVAVRRNQMFFIRTDIGRSDG